MNSKLTLPPTHPFADNSGAKVGFLRNVWRLRHWIKPYSGRLLIAITLAMMAALAAVLAPVVFSRVLVDDVLLHATQQDAPDFAQHTVAAWIGDTLHASPLVSAALLYLLWVVVRVAASFSFEVLLSRAVLAALADLRTALFAHVERLPASFYDRAKIGQIMTRITDDIESLAELLSSVGALAGELVPFAIAAAIMLALDPTLTAEITPLMLLVLAATLLFRHFSGPIYQRMREAFSRINEHLHEYLSGIEVVQLSGREALNARRFGQLLQTNRSLENRAIKLETAYFPLVESVIFLAFGCVLWLGGDKVHTNAISLGTLILFLQFCEMLFRPIVVFGFQASVLFRAGIACDRIFRLLDWREALQVPAQPTALPDKLRGAIEFRQLDFSYGSGIPVIRNLSLQIAAGETIAIVGATGSGKTTLSRLISRFYDVPAGTLFIDGIDIMQLAPEALRRRQGLVLQDFHLFTGSIYDNIALGNPAVTREQARQAAQWVQALHFIDALPQGLDTPLDDRGQNLSQGQRQLLVFARIFAQNPDILILDEATASIDPITEAALQAAVNQVTRERTSIIIAHRLQTIRHADRIVVLDKGKLAEVGTHGELMARAGLYRALYEAQVLGKTE